MCEICDSRKSNASESYFEMLRNSPREAAGNLRKLHAIKDTRRFSLVHELREFLNVDTTEIRWDSFYSTGLHQVVQEIAADPQTYVAARDNPRSENYVRDIFSCLFSLADSLVLNTRDLPLKYGDYSLIFLTKLPEVWECVWKNGVVASRLQFQSALNHSLLEILIVLQDCQLRLREIHWDSNHPFSAYEWKTLFFCWTGCDTYETRHRAVFNLRQLSDGTCSHSLHDLFEQVLADVSISEDVASRIDEGITHSQLTSDERWTFLCWLTLLTRKLPTDMAKALSYRTASWMTQLAQGYQTELCTGDDGDYRECITTITLTAMNNVLAASPDFGLESIIEAPEVPFIISGAIVPAILAKDEVGFESWISVTYIYAEAGATTLEEEPESGFLLDLINPLKERYGQVLRAIRKVPKNANYNEFRSRALKAWSFLGASLRLKENHRRLVNDKQNWLPPKPCHWGKCLCSTVFPQHPMRVCKGCWRVFYCSARCQELDWKDGYHRNVCPGKRSKRSRISPP